MQTLVVVLGLGASLSLLTGAEKPAAPSSVPAPPGLPLRIVPFLMAKERQARAVVQRNHLEWTQEVADLFAAATNGDCALASDLLGMYPHLSPHGLIMKLNRRPIETLPADALAKDRQEWTDRLRPLLGGWLDPETSLAEVCDFAERTYLQKDLTGFTGDPKFLDALPARNFCSKLRSSLGGLYAWRATNTKKPEERDRMQQEADFAFRQAFALCPACPEAIFRYVNLLSAQGRIEDARQLAAISLKLDSANRQLADLLNQIERMGKR